ncbi:hypothetical protein LX69_02129, partial [Breznakibacter xylanolyticus]
MQPQKRSRRSNESDTQPEDETIEILIFFTFDHRPSPVSVTKKKRKNIWKFKNKVFIFAARLGSQAKRKQQETIFENIGKYLNTR